MKIVLESVVEALSTRQDGSIVIKLASQEADPAQAGSLFQLRGKFVKVLLSDTKISTIEENLVDEQEMEDKKKKTMSQQLRSILFIVHREKGITQDFNTWYKNEMSAIISGYRDVLNELNS